MNRTYPSYEFKSVAFQDDKGNTVRYGPSRIVVEPLDARRKGPVERTVDTAFKCFVIGCALYLLAEIFRAFANGSLPVSR